MIEFLNKKIIMVFNKISEHDKDVNETRQQNIAKRKDKMIEMSRMA